LLDHTVTVDGASFRIADGFDVDLLKHRLARAVTYDPSYVDFETSNGHHISVLVSAATKVCFESAEKIPARHQAEGESQSMFLSPHQVPGAAQTAELRERTLRAST
jgi:Ethanolamine utilization protein EutJ (predicted chaperonin)